MEVIFWNGGISWKMLSRYVGPYKIAHWLRKHGHTCQVIDFIDHFSEEKLYAATKKFITEDTKIIAISTTFISNNLYKWKSEKYGRIPEYCIDVLRIIKKEYPSIKVVVGGYMSDHVNGWGVVDATVMSYTEASEDIFLEYLEYLQGLGPQPMSRIIFPKWNKFGKHRILYDSARTKKYNIENDDFRFIKQDCILPKEPLPLDVSRGCIFACKFCQYPHLGKKKLDYIRGMEYIESEIRHNYEMWGTTNYYILDDTFNDTEIKLKAFHDMTQRLPFKITYSAYLRADLIHRFPDMAHMLQDSGLFGAYHGIETFHPTASKLIGKGWSGKHAKKFIPELFHNIWKEKVPMHTNFIVGITGDTENNVLDTARWFIDNKMHSIQFNVLGLYGPKNFKNKYTIESEFDKNAEKYGFTFTPSKSEEPGHYVKWKNDNWSAGYAKKFAKDVSRIVKEYKKTNIWVTSPLLWYGYDKDYILKTRSVDVNRDEIVEKSTEFFQQYYNLLMSL